MLHLSDRRAAQLTMCPSSPRTNTMQDALPVDIFANLNVASIEIDFPGEMLQIDLFSSGSTWCGNKARKKAS